MVQGVWMRYRVQARGPFNGRDPGQSGYSGNIAFGDILIQETRGNTLV